MLSFISWIRDKPKFRYIQTIWPLKHTRAPPYAPIIHGKCKFYPLSSTRYLQFITFIGGFPLQYLTFLNVCAAVDMIRPPRWIYDSFISPIYKFLHSSTIYTVNGIFPLTLAKLSTCIQCQLCWLCFIFTSANANGVSWNECITVRSQFSRATNY